MHRFSTTLTILAVAAFIGSGLWHALADPHTLTGPADLPAMRQMQSLLMFPAHSAGQGWPAASSEMAREMLSADQSVLGLLLLAVWAGLIVHAGRMILNQIRTERAAAMLPRAPRSAFLDHVQAGPRPVGQVLATHGADHAPVELAPIAVALAAGAAWPWVSSATLALALAGTMMLAAITAAVRGQRDGTRVRHSLAVGLFAGWATVAAFAVFAGFVARTVGLPDEVASVVAVIICAVTGVMVQMNLGKAASYSVGLTWGLVGLATLTMADSPMIALAAILGISAMAGVLVRATT